MQKSDLRKGMFVRTRSNEVYVMDYKVFKEMVRSYIRKAGEKIAVQFYRDIEHGRYCAKCSNGIRIAGTPGSFKLKVQWGSNYNHTAFVDTKGV